MKTKKQMKTETAKLPIIQISNYADFSDSCDKTSDTYYKKEKQILSEFLKEAMHNKKINTVISVEYKFDGYLQFLLNKIVPTPSGMDVCVYEFIGAARF
jgi:hypothetical protein